MAIHTEKSWEKWERSWGLVTVGSMEGETVFVLRCIGPNCQYFRAWFHDPQERKASFHFVSILALARGFLDKTLAEIFQKFLQDNKHPTELFEVERGRLLKIYGSPWPRKS